MKSKVMLALSIFIIATSMLNAGYSKEEKVVIKRLKDYLSLEFKKSDVIKAYDEYYSSRFKNILARYRGITDAQSYYASNPEVDFEFVTKVKDVLAVQIKDEVAYVKAKTKVTRVAWGTSEEAVQIFKMKNENGKWVYCFE